MYFYASYVFQEAGIPYDKIQYSVIGTGSCELIMSMTCVRILSPFLPTQYGLLDNHKKFCSFAELLPFLSSIQDTFVIAQ